MMKKIKIMMLLIIASLMSGCVAPGLQVAGSIKTTPTKPKYLDGTTYPYQFNTPITGYQNPAMGAPRTIRIKKLAELKPTNNIFVEGDTFISSTELVLGGNHRVPATLTVRSGKKIKNMAVLSYSNGYADCLYALSPMGKDENSFRYYKQVPHQKRAVLCDADRVVRIEQRNDGTLRVSSQSIDTGVEQWAGLFYKMKKDAQVHE